MNVHRYHSVPDFSRDVLPTLREDEVTNNLPIGILAAAPKRDTSSWLLYRVCEGADTALVAVCTPPYGIVLCAAEGADFARAARALALALKDEGIKLTGTGGRRALTREFALAYAGEGGFSTRHELVTMRLDTAPPPAEVPGQLREITREDLHFLPFWGHQFGVECGVDTQSVSDIHTSFAARVGARNLYIWQDETPCAMTAIGRVLSKGSVINYVYSLPFLRGKGYGRAAVSAVCREIFARGGTFTALFANSKNPVSCGLYHSLGFVDVCEYDELIFE